MPVWLLCECVSFCIQVVFEQKQNMMFKKKILNIIIIIIIIIILVCTEKSLGVRVCASAEAECVSVGVLVGLKAAVRPYCDYYDDHPPKALLFWGARSMRF